MAFWLFKEEPTHFSFVDLEAVRDTDWTGISNALALQHLRQCRVGDQVFYYHTGKERAVVGIAEVIAASNSQADPGVIISIRAVRRLQFPVPLSVIKKDKLLSEWELVRLPRLSVLPVSKKQWRKVERLSKVDHGCKS